MKKFLILLLIGISIYCCSSTKIEEKEIKYFNENNIEISKSEFKKLNTNSKFLGLTIDSTNHKKLILRENYGSISNRAALEELLENVANRELESSKPLVIIYYPGKDKCNSAGGFTDKSWVKNWRIELEEGLNRVANVKPIYIFKKKEGLESHRDVIELRKDPENIVERLFFKDHYPCGSFVVISEDGDYVSYLGEYPKSFVWAAAKMMIK
ncbi:MAG: hypothetical protein HKN40_10505 [Winogradskyella sp.]|uniref:hypothetical protein n=1 Tax=Winogradskyella sp. TaxID=1883156 RepID=UPI001838C7D2|nr:hypothetical protein [Winogradskyella sp.]